MKRFVLLAVTVLLVLGTVAGCAGGTSAVQEQEEALDDAIHDLELVFGRYLSVDPGGSVEEVERATDRVSSAWSDVVIAAQGLDEVDLSEAQAAHDALVEATAGIPAGVTASDGVAMIQAEIDAFSEAVEQMHDDLDFH